MSTTIPGKTLVLRASNNTDPTVSGYVEIYLSVLEARPLRPRVGKRLGYWNGRSRQTKERRKHVHVVCLGFSTEAGDSTALLMDYGHFTLLEDMTSQYDHFWIMDALEDGSNPSSGKLSRAGKHSTGTTGSNSHWTEWGLPWECYLVDELSPSMNDAGEYDLEFDLEGVTTI